MMATQTTAAADAARTAATNPAAHKSASHTAIAKVATGPRNLFSIRLLFIGAIIASALLFTAVSSQQSTMRTLQQPPATCVRVSARIGIVGVASTGDGGASTGDGGASTDNGDASTGAGEASTGAGGASTDDGDASTEDGGASTCDGEASTGDSGASTGDGDASTGDGGCSDDSCVHFDGDAATSAADAKGGIDARMTSRRREDGDGTTREDGGDAKMEGSDAKMEWSDAKMEWGGCTISSKTQMATSGHCDSDGEADAESDDELDTEFKAEPEVVSDDESDSDDDADADGDSDLGEEVTAPVNVMDMDGKATVNKTMDGKAAASMFFSRLFVVGNVAMSALGALQRRAGQLRAGRSTATRVRVFAGTLTAALQSHSPPLIDGPGTAATPAGKTLISL
jgi:hypothetical protein